jgi:putative transposase
MRVWLTKDLDYKVCGSRIEMIYYWVIGLRAVLPGKYPPKVQGPPNVSVPAQQPRHRVSKSGTGHRYHIYPHTGYLYLVVIMDLHSR